MSAIREAGFVGDDDTGAGGNSVMMSRSELVMAGRPDRGGGQETEQPNTGAPDQNARRGGVATVTMRHLVSAARASAARPGVTREMMKGYDNFASGLG